MYSSGYDILIKLHKSATAKPAIRDALRNATGSNCELPRQFNVSRDPIREWRSRNTVADCSHRLHRLQSTLDAAQEELVIYLRTELRLSLDDLLSLVREFVEPATSLSALDLLLRRCNLSRLAVHLKPNVIRVALYGCCNVSCLAGEPASPPANVLCL